MSAAKLDQVSKIVGVSDDLDKVQRCEADARAAFGERATANRSQPYYLDVTNKDANKGAVVEFLSRHLGVPVAEIATIGDQPTDVPMFKRSGFSIAMGNAPDRGQGAGQRHHGFLQRRRLRQGDGTLHSGRMIEVRHGDEWAHRNTCRSGGACAPRGRLDDVGGACGEGRLSGCRCPAARPRRRCSRCWPPMSSSDVFPGRGSPGTGATSASFPTIIRRATTG